MLCWGHVQQRTSTQMVIPFSLVVLMYLPSSCATKLHEKPPASECCPPFPNELACPPPPFPDDLPHPPLRPPMPPETSYVYYSPPPPMTFLQSEFPFPRQPPEAPVLSSFIVRLLSAFVGSALFALLVVGCRAILIRRWAPPNHPLPAPNRGVEVEMPRVHVGMQGGLVETTMADPPL